MKKYVAFVLVGSLVLLLSSCGLIADVPQTINVNNVNCDGFMGATPSWETPLMTQAEVDAFAASENAPEGFVGLNCVSVVGAFNDCLVFNNDKYTNYIYCLLDENQGDLALTVKHGDNSLSEHLEDNTTLQVNNSMTSMYRLNTNETGNIIRNGVTYFYLNGRFTFLLWHMKDMEITLQFTVSSEGDKYPLDGKETFLAKLLSLDDDVMNEALDEFIAAYNKSLK